jgi:hypothetical protein
VRGDIRDPSPIPLITRQELHHGTAHSALTFPPQLSHNNLSKGEFHVMGGRVSSDPVPVLKKVKTNDGANNKHV